MDSIPRHLRRRIVAIPGWSCGDGIWSRLLADAGCGAAAHVPVGAARTQQDFLPLVRASLNAEPAVLLGSSLGAMLAIEAALRYPAWVQALVLIGGTPRFTTDDRARGWPVRFIERIRRRIGEDPAAAVAAFQAGMFVAGEESAAGAFQQDPACHGGWTVEALGAGLDYLLATDVTDALDALECPVLWIHGAADAICPVGAIRDVPARHERCVIPAAGHLLGWTRPRDVVETIRRVAFDA